MSNASKLCDYTNSQDITSEITIQSFCYNFIKEYCTDQETEDMFYNLPNFEEYYYEE